MSLWLLVRDTQEVEAAYSQAREMLTWARRNGAVATSAEIDGIWVNADMAAQPPAVLSSRDETGQAKRFRIHETSGPAGIWLLCRIEADEPGQTADSASVIQALLAAAEEASSHPHERSVPILSALTASSEKKVSASAPSLTLVKK